MPKFDASIVLITWSPTKRRLAFLKRTIASLRRKAGYPFTLVVVDNGPQVQTDYLARECADDIVITNKVNLGVGTARNQGADATNSHYIAFIDNDLEFVSDNWLFECIKALEAFPEQKLIATPRRSHPMKGPKKVAGNLGKYLLFDRASAMCLVMRRSDYQAIGRWPGHSMPGSKYCDWTYRKGYKFVWHPSWAVKHLAKKPSYNFHHSLVNGKWVELTPQERKIEKWNAMWPKKYKQYIKKHCKMYPAIRRHLKGRIVDLAVGVTDMYREGHDVTGVDISSACVEIMKQRHSWGNWIVGDAMRTQLPSHCFDTGVAANILEHYHDQGAIIRELKRLLRKNGRAILVVPKANFAKDHVLPKWTPAMLEERIGSHFDCWEYELYAGRWWVVTGTDAPKESIT